YKRSDDKMIEEVNQRLEQDGGIDASEIEVSCKDSIVTLKGKVEDRRSKRRAEECAEDIYGVQDVMNLLTVDQGFFASLFSSGESDEKRVKTSKQRKG